MLGGLPPAPKWAWVAMVAGVIAIAIMLPIAIGRGQTEVSAARTSAASEPSAAPTTTAPDPTTAPEEPDPSVVAVYGDNYSAGSDEGGTGAAGWPALLAERIDAEVRVHAEGGAGYVAVASGTGRTFGDLVRSSPEPEADVVVVFGSRNDTGVATETVSSAAADVFEAILATSPSAELVVIGPAWSDEVPPAETLLARDAVESAATEAGVTFVDPLEDGWFFGRLDLIGADAINPTDEGHAYLADLIEPVVREALGAATAVE